MAELHASAGPPVTAAEQLQLDTTVLTQRQAQHALEFARGNAREHGLASEAVYVPLRFRLSDPARLDPAATSAVRILELQILEAEALLEQAATLDTVPDVRIGTSYRNASENVDFGGGWR